MRRVVDVAQAFGEEVPTKPAIVETSALAQLPEAQGAAPDDELTSYIPLDVVPVLAVPRAEVPWDSLGDLATQLLLRVDGATRAMAIVTGTTGTPTQGARELAALAERGLVRLVVRE